MLPDDGRSGVRISQSRRMHDRVERTLAAVMVEPAVLPTDSGIFVTSRRDIANCSVNFRPKLFEEREVGRPDRPDRGAIGRPLRWVPAVIGDKCE